MNYYWNHSNVSLIFTMATETLCHCSFSVLAEPKIGKYKSQFNIIQNSQRNKIPKALSSLMFTLPMNFVDYDATKGKYRYCYFKVKNLSLAINSISNFSYLRRMLLKIAPKINLKKFRKASCYNIREMCRQNRRWYWHCYFEI